MDCNFVQWVASVQDKPGVEETKGTPKEIMGGVSRSILSGKTLEA